MAEEILHYNFIKEYIDIFNRDIRIIDKFRPDKQAPVTEKFYARHDAYEQDLNIKDDRLSDIANKKNNGPRQLYPQPVLESHVYGWYHHLATRYDDFDYKLLHHGRINTPMTVHGIRILMDKLRK